MSIVNDRQYRVISGRHLHGLPIGNEYHGYLHQGVVFLDAGHANHTQCDPADVCFIMFNREEPAPHCIPSEPEGDLPMP